ncbi:MAG: NAD(P)-binding domain-containing protein [Bacteroides sp.]|nr:MAG: NAD(P)-binding domain-containing protein [Bacteroides sp.]
MNRYYLCIIGGGKIGISFAEGLIYKNILEINNIIISKKNINPNFNKFNITYDNQYAVKYSKIIILSVLPSQLKEVLNDIKHVIKKDHIIISFVAGIEIDYIKLYLNNHINIIRIIPNIAIRKGESIICIVNNNNVNNKIINHLFSKLGFMLFLDESCIDAATSLFSSNIAFIAYLMKPVNDLIINKINTNISVSNLLLIQLLKGFISLIKNNKKNIIFDSLINDIASHRGFTVKGIQYMEKKNVQKNIINAILNSYNK